SHLILSNQQAKHIKIIGDILIKMQKAIITNPTRSYFQAVKINDRINRKDNIYIALISTNDFSETINDRKNNQTINDNETSEISFNSEISVYTKDNDKNKNVNCHENKRQSEDEIKPSGSSDLEVDATSTYNFNENFIISIGDMCINVRISVYSEYERLAHNDKFEKRIFKITRFETEKRFSQLDNSEKLLRNRKFMKIRFNEPEKIKINDLEDAFNKSSNQRKKLKKRPKNGQKEWINFVCRA
ncbi:20127_t:CDS:2, partial [Gigaspora margarita]